MNDDYRVRCYVPGKKPIREWHYQTEREAEVQRDGILRMARVQGAAVVIIVRPPTGKSERVELAAGPPSFEPSPSPSTLERKAAGEAARKAREQEALAVKPVPKEDRPSFGMVCWVVLLAVLGAVPRGRRRGGAIFLPGSTWGGGWGGDSDSDV